MGNALRVFEQHTPDLTDRCLLLYMEPEKGVTVAIDTVAPLFAQTWPRAQAIGVLPRAPRQVSMADEEGDRYLSPLDVAPHSQLHACGPPRRPGALRPDRAATGAADAEIVALAAIARRADRAGAERGAAGWSDW